MNRSTAPVLLALSALLAGCASAPITTIAPGVSPIVEASPTTTSPGVPTFSPAPSPSHEPVVLAAAGQTQVELQAGAIPFVARDGGRADCRSVPDSQTVADITALDLGELGSGTLRAMIGVPVQLSDGATAELFIDGGDLPEGSPQLSWSGPVQVTELGAEGASGKLTFTSLGLANPASKPDPASSVLTSAAPGWPATISGSLSWTCQPWATPLPDSVAPPPSVAP